MGFLILPPIIKWQMRKQLSVLTHRQAQVKTVRVNPLALSLTIRGLALTEPDGGRFASWSNFYVNFEAFGSVVNWAWTFKRIRLDEPYGYVAWLTNGQFNFSNLLTNSTPAPTNPAPSGPPPRVLVHSLSVSNGALEFADFNRAKPFQTKFVPINVFVKGFTTRPRADSPYSFIATTGDGESFAWSGDFTVVPPGSQGRFELAGIDLKKYGPYAADFVQFELRDGKVTVAAEYRLALQTTGLDLSVTNARVDVSNVQIGAPDTGDTIVSVPSFQVRGASANLVGATADVESVQTTDGTILARRFRSGELQFAALAKPATNVTRAFGGSVPQTNTAGPGAPPWSVRIHSIGVSNYTVKVEDAQPATPASLVADQIAVALTNISNITNSRAGVQFSARLNNGGTVGVEGSVLAFPPLQAELALNVRDIELRPLDPYVGEQVKLAITSGRVSTEGRARLVMEGTNAPRASFEGDVRVEDFASADKIVFQDFVKWKGLALKGINASLNPLALKLDEISCLQLVTAVVLDSNRQPTFLSMLPSATNTAAATTNVAASAPAPDTGSALPDIQVGIVAFTNASVQLADFSVQPPCRFVVQQFSGTVSNITSASNAIALLDIVGRVDEGAPFAVQGKLTPFAPDALADVTVSMKGTELTAFTPYMEKYAGHPLTKGKVTLDLRYDVQQRALKAENAVFIDQLTLGQRNDSPDAVKLPVKLGVALLKDRNGRIELNVPLNGRLDDPKFKVGPVVMQVVMNLLTKAATSPFSLLGALVGGGEELSFIEFAPGQASIPEAEIAKIDKLGRALYERPALNLEIAGSTDDALDRAALGWLKLERVLKMARMAELTGKSDAPASVDDIRFEPREYVRALRSYYKQTFERSRPLPESSVPTTNAVTGEVTGISKTTRRIDTRKGAEILIARDPARTPEKATNSVSVANDPRLMTRPSALPALDPDDDVLAQMEGELFARMEVTPNDLRGLEQQRARSVQRALLQTEKVEGDRLFILAPKAPEAASKGQTRAILSLN